MVEVRDGTWEVGDAGSVTFVADGQAIRLVSVNPRQGWTPSVVREALDRLEVDFRRGREVRELEVRYRHGLLRVEVESEDEAAQPGRFTVGDAGEVEIAVDDGQLRLVEVATSPRWAMQVLQETAGMVEVRFRQDAAGWDFKADLTQRGRLEIAMELRLEAPYPVRAPTGA